MRPRSRPAPPATVAPGPPEPRSHHGTAPGAGARAPAAGPALESLIVAALPPRYGRVSCNVSEPGVTTGDRIGLVVPSYRRFRLLGACLDSLSRSHLPNTVVCIVDESAAHGLPELAGYRLLRGLDSPGFDLGVKHGGLQELKARCDRDPRCAGFTSLGVLKTRIGPARRLVRQRFTAFGLYVKDARRRVIRAALRQRQEQLLAALHSLQLRAALRHWRAPSVPAITIRKRQHGHMFDSLRVGWDLLTGLFGCTYLCCLDSDTVVKPHWIEALRQQHQRSQEWAPNPFTIVTGFNARNHPILADHDTYRLKQSVGGVNLFFHAKIYPVLRPALTHIDWDHEIVGRIRRLQGTLICTRPSVVQHCGRSGLWSRPTAFDVADDFEERT